MARKTKSGRHQLNLYEELKGILDEFTGELKAKKEVALDKASDYLVDKLEQASPTGNPEETYGKPFKNSWLRTYKYKGVRYIGNSKTAKNSSIPLSNLIEFSKNGKPFIRQTFDINRTQIENIIKGELNKDGNSK